MRRLFFSNAKGLAGDRSGEGEGAGRPSLRATLSPEHRHCTARLAHEGGEPGGKPLPFRGLHTSFLPTPTDQTLDACPGGTGACGFWLHNPVNVRQLY